MTISAFERRGVETCRPLCSGVPTLRGRFGKTRTDATDSSSGLLSCFLLTGADGDGDGEKRRTESEEKGGFFFCGWWLMKREFDISM